MYHEIVVVDQDPPPVAHALNAQRADTFFLERFLDVAGDGGDLPVGRSRADEKEIGEGGTLPDVQCADPGGFFILRKPRALDDRVSCRYGRPSSPVPRYRPCSAM